jgi:hypothetical protein
MLDSAELHHLEHALTSVAHDVVATAARASGMLPAFAAIAHDLRAASHDLDRAAEVLADARRRAELERAVVDRAVSPLLSMGLQP